MANNMFSVSVSWKRQYSSRRDPRLAAMQNDYAVEVFFKPGVTEPRKSHPEAGMVAKWLMEDGVGETGKVWDVWGIAREKYSRRKWQRFVYRMIPDMIGRGRIQNIYQGYWKFAQIVKQDFISVINTLWTPKLEHKTVLNKKERGIASRPSKPLIESGTMRGAVWVRVKKIMKASTPKGMPEGYYDKETTIHRGQWPSFIK